jgi:hypothetical protein
MATNEDLENTKLEEVIDEDLEDTELEEFINDIIKIHLKNMNHSFDDLMNKVKKMNLLEKKEEIIPTKDNAAFYKGQILHLWTFKTPISLNIKILKI